MKRNNTRFSLFVSILHEFIRFFQIIFLKNFFGKLFYENQDSTLYN